jgi:hypothetical protein
MKRDRQGADFIPPDIASITNRKGGGAIAAIMARMKVSGVLLLTACAYAQNAAPEYKNLEILKGMPPERVPMVMNVFNRVLGVQCTHCHVEGAMEKGDKPQFATTRKMFRMRNWIASEQKVNVTCWSCHRGSALPAKYEAPAEMRWPPNLKLAAEQESQPAEQVYKNVTTFKGIPAGRFPVIMNMFSKSLGVNCLHCHVAGEWDKDDKEPKAAARQMMAMVRATTKEFWAGNGPLACFTCHHGALKPEVNPPAQ